MNHHTHVLNLTKSNAENTPIWFHEYSARSTYNLTNLTARGWHEWTNTLENEILNIKHYGIKNFDWKDFMIGKYLNYRFKSYNNQYYLNCDYNCLSSRLCLIRSGAGFSSCPPLKKKNYQNEQLVFQIDEETYPSVDLDIC